MEAARGRTVHAVRLSIQILVIDVVVSQVRFYGSGRKRGGKDDILCISLGTQGREEIDSRGARRQRHGVCRDIRQDAGLYPGIGHRVACNGVTGLIRRQTHS